MSADGSDERDHAQVAEVTDLVKLSRWPDGTPERSCAANNRILAPLHLRRHSRSPLPDVHHRPDRPDIVYLEVLQRGRGRAEKLIENLRATGLANFRSVDMAINAAWLITALIFRCVGLREWKGGLVVSGRAGSSKVPHVAALTRWGMALRDDGAVLTGLDAGFRRRHGDAKCRRRLAAHRAVDAPPRTESSVS